MFNSEKNRQSIALLAVLLAALPTFAVATEYDLSPSGTQSFNVTGDFGGTAIVSDYWSQPTGTGVFNPFLSLDANGQTSTGSKLVESAYNADGHNALYLDGHRPSWNTSLHVGDLAPITIGGVNYYGFVLDANEPSSKSLLSVDNIRIYTSSTDNTGSVQNNLQNLDSLGTLRWALNNPIATFSSDGTPTFNIANWIKLDAKQENINTNANGGSGQADMILYIPQAAFGNAGANDYVWFYNLNGVHYSVATDLGAQAGYEEWSAVVKAGTPVPDNATTGILIGLGLLLMAFARYRFRSN